MTLSDLLYGPWALRPEVLVEMQAVYEARTRGESFSPEAFEAAYGSRDSSSQDKRYDVVDGVAILPVAGVLAPKANLMTMICGGMSTQMIGAEATRAAQDNKVESILLHVDTPGGSVIGPPELTSLIREIAQVKPVVAFCDGVMASAGMWIGSGANSRFISGPTTMVGNIGVVASHTNQAGSAGSNKTEITAGKYKRIASSNGPLSKEGAAYMQAQVDYLYSIFVNTLAENLGVSADVVLKHMADGRDFIGIQAIDAGLVNDVISMDALLADMSSNPGRYAKRTVARPKATSAPPPAQKSAPQSASSEALFLSPVQKENVMSEQAQASAPVITRETLERDHSALFATLRSEFLALGASSERERIVGVRAQSLPGHEALVEQLAFDGKTSPGEAAMAINAAERAATAAAAAAHFNDAPAAVKPSTVDASSSAKTREQQAAEATAYADENGVDFVTAMKKLGYA